MAEPAGILFIGDPHLGSRRPGRRRDPDFVAACLEKLEQGIALATAGNLLPVILGDLFDRAREDDHRLLVRTIRILRGAPHQPLCLVGNHDRIDARLGDDTALALVREAGAVRTIERSGPVLTQSLGGRMVGLGATPHGDPIPEDVTGQFPGAEVVLWLTHHDLAIGRPYPGAQPIHPIRGCDVVVNGHMHGLEPARQAGGTLWFNPGNILRQSVDMLDHLPSTWAWDPAAPLTFARRPLRHERDVFDLTGRHAAPVAPDAAQRPSVFAELLAAESRSEMERTEDGSVLLEEIARLFEDEAVTPEVRDIVLALHRGAVAEER